ncbi:NAD-dependent epimerase/dehydratase family protein [Cytobacillus sp. Hz8]|uniref:NAD-dependent epimerase/dehydratase family protein n=1 Tax=Cytobacillus sp. Hz8 TaxID=3347168 RepID=UPI0035DF6755
MKKALVLGATGSMGNALVNALTRRNIPTIAFSRSLNKLEEYKKDWNPSVELFAGDALKKTDIEKAIANADYIFHAINVPYQDWQDQLKPLLLNILHECRKQNKPFIYVDNIYSYGRQLQKTTELAIKQPHTKKGKLRLQLLKEIEASGVSYLIAHFPDFYGPKAGNTLLQYTFEQVLKKKSGGFIGDLTIPREFIYVKDGAEALVDLAMHEGAYGETWNIPGAGTITGREIQQILSEYFGCDIRLSRIHKWMIQAIGLFQPFMREYVEMMYLNETPVILDGIKFETRIGQISKTPYELGIKETLNEMRKN